VLERIPADVVAAADYERHAAAVLAPDIFAHIAGGSGEERTLRGNRAAFDSWLIHSRVLVDCEAGSTATRLLGDTLSHPLLLAPVAYQKLVHPAGEIATAQAADALDTTMIVSTQATAPLEELARELRRKWFQLYFQPERGETATLVARAEIAGYSAIVVTIDVPVTALRQRAARAGFQHPAELKAANIVDRNAALAAPLAPGASRVFQGAMAKAPTWRDLEWLRTQTNLPLLVKGVLHPDDAVRAIELGIDGIVVSNHGGRALDGVPAALTALQALRARTGPEFPLLVDGGIRSGGDAFKALALGANAVLIGRPQLYALAVAGAAGVAHLLRVLRDELEVTMALAGCPTIASITTGALTRADRYFTAG
jgi:isopentenyl diphosphate isomerase/L-lactate dehydrogenase-like FMN-dependent dehydrogenase